MPHTMRRILGEIGIHWPADHEQHHTTHSHALISPERPASALSTIALMSTSMTGCDVGRPNSIPDTQRIVQVPPPSEKTVHPLDHLAERNAHSDTGLFSEGFKAIADAERTLDGKKPTEKSSSRVDGVLVTTDHAIIAGQSADDKFKSMEDVYETSDLSVIKTARNVADGFLDSFPTLLSTLELVSELHPFIKGAVAVFRVSIELAIKLRDNKKTARALLISMADTMKALTYLRDIADEKLNVKPKDAKEDSIVKKTKSETTMKDRLQELVKDIEIEIKSCANVIDTYQKRHLIARVVNAKSWTETLKSNIENLHKKRDGIMFHLQIFNHERGREGVHQMASIEGKLDTLLAIFAIDPTLQQKLQPIIYKAGPDNIANNNAVKTQLLEVASRWGKDGQAQCAFDRKELAQMLEKLGRELEESIGDAIDANMVVFIKKFDLQMERLEAIVHQESKQTQDVVRREVRHLKDVLGDGPHARIENSEIRHVWKEMNWRGHVETRHFVCALRDYYLRYVQDQKFKERQRHLSVFESSVGDTIEDQHGAKPDAQDAAYYPDVGSQDEWALEWVSGLHRLRSIADAFDDDGSGFITIADVNQFTSSCPKDWSLLHWLAYWATGWQMTASGYRLKILKICARMFTARRTANTSNQNAIDRYLKVVWKRVSTLMYSLVTASRPSALRQEFNTYVKAEENRLEEGLKMVEYRIDAQDTLSLITGPGRIEKYIMPLLYILLDRHLHILRVCNKTVVDDREFRDAAHSIERVFDAVTARHDELNVSFMQQRIPSAQEFKIHANELFDYWHDGTQFWSLDNLRNFHFLEDQDYENSSSEVEDDKNDTSPTGSRYMNLLSYSGEFDANRYRVPPRPHCDAGCDVCRKSLYGPRWVCLECGSRFTFDFCDNGYCANQVVETRDDITAPHLPTHDFVKIRATIHYHREIGRVLRSARDGLDRARKLFSSRDGGTNKSTQPSNESYPLQKMVDGNETLFECVSCRQTVSQPCWFCVDCEDWSSPVFVCMTCDSKKGGISVGNHEGKHNLVRCTKAAQVGQGTTINERLTALENCMDRIEKTLQLLVVPK